MREKEAPPPPPRVQTRYAVQLYDGRIMDPDNREERMSFYPRPEFITRNIILAKAVSEDIREEKIRDLQQSIIDTTEKLKELRG